MAAGTYKLDNLSPEEYKAALAAVKLVRGNEIKNAYQEGWRDGWEANRRVDRGEYISGDGWEQSHAKALYESKGDNLAKMIKGE